MVLNMRDILFKVWRPLLYNIMMTHFIYLPNISRKLLMKILKRI